MNSMQLLEEAQFHGAKWLASSKYRFYWASALIVFFCCSVSILLVAVNRYFQNPTYVAHNEITQPMMPFPTVILCPEVEFPQFKIDAFLEEITYPPDINISSVEEALPQLSAFFSPDAKYVIKDLKMIQYVLDYNNMSIEAAGKLLTLNCRETFIRGLSDHGVQSTESHRKLFVNSIGFTNSLMLAVNQSGRPLGSLDLSYKWLALQTAQYSDMIYNGTAVSPAAETWAGYSSTALHVTADAERLGPALRHCRMVHEPLAYFPVYHKRYCLLECEMELVRQHCNCVQVVHPHAHAHDAVPICSAQHIACVRETAGVSFSDDYYRCSCPPSCDSEIETMIISSYDLVRDSQEIDDFYADLDFDNVSIIRVFVLKHNRRVMSRYSYFPFHMLFSQLGGVFGVFFGCSVLSLLEAVQLAWFAARHHCRQRRANQQLRFKKNVKTGVQFKK